MTVEIKDLFQKIKFEYTSLISREPLLAPFYWPNIWWQQYKIWRYYRDQGGVIRECYVNHTTEFVIDGFQGSANSFAADAFKMSHQNSVALAHHMHSPAQIIKATRRNIPTLVTIREPVGTVLSLTSRWPYVSPRQALRSYVGFYGKLEPYQDKYVLSTFEQTTQHLGSVVERVNDYFHTDFDIDNQSLKKMRAKHVPDACLLIAGKGPLATELQAHIDARGLDQHVCMLGLCARQRPTPGVSGRECVDRAEPIA